MNKKTVSTILKSIAVAMGIAVIVLSILGGLASKYCCFAAQHWPDRAGGCCASKGIISPGLKLDARRASVSYNHSKA